MSCLSVPICKIKKIEWFKLKLKKMTKWPNLEFGTNFGLKYPNLFLFENRTSIFDLLQTSFMQKIEGILWLVIRENSGLDGRTNVGISIGLPPKLVGPKKIPPFIAIVDVLEHNKQSFVDPRLLMLLLFCCCYCYVVVAVDKLFLPGNSAKMNFWKIS